jgi:hypothetical protein
MPNNVINSIVSQTITGIVENGSLPVGAAADLGENITTSSGLVTDLINLGTLGATLDADTIVGTAANLRYHPVNSILFDGVSGSYLSAPNSVANSITGDIEIVMRLRLADLTPSANFTITGKAKNTANRSFFIQHNVTTGYLGLYTSPDGSVANQVAATSTVSLNSVASDNDLIWLRITRDVDNGAGGNTTTFEYSLEDTSDVDSVTWIALNAPIINSGTTSLHANDSPIEIGAAFLGTSQPNKQIVNKAYVYNGIGGEFTAGETVKDFEGIDHVVPADNTLTAGNRFVQNMVNFSEAADPLNWLLQNDAALVSNDNPAPDGRLKARRYSLPSNNSRVLVRTDVCASNNDHTDSIWIRADVAGNIRMTEGSNGLYAVDLPITTEWQRFNAQWNQTTGNSIWLTVERDTLLQLDHIEIAYPQREDVEGQSNQNPSEYSVSYNGDDFAEYTTYNGNTVTDNVVTEATGADLPAYPPIAVSCNAADANNGTGLDSDTFVSSETGETWTMAGTTVANNTGKDAVFFGGSVTLATSAGVDIAGAKTVIMVMRPLDPAPAADQRFLDVKSDSLKELYIGTNNTLADKYTANNGGTAITLAEAYDTDWRIVVLQATGDATATLEVVGVGTVTGDIGSDTFDALTLGGLMNFSVAKIYNRNLEPFEIQNVIDSLTYELKL